MMHGENEEKGVLVNKSMSTPAKLLSWNSLPLILGLCREHCACTLVGEGWQCETLNPEP